MFHELAVFSILRIKLIETDICSISKDLMVMVGCSFHVQIYLLPCKLFVFYTFVDVCIVSLYIMLKSLAIKIIIIIV